jgi:hypothetical protein
VKGQGHGGISCLAMAPSIANGCRRVNEDIHPSIVGKR